MTYMFRMMKRCYKMILEQILASGPCQGRLLHHDNYYVAHSQIIRKKERFIQHLQIQFYSYDQRMIMVNECVGLVQVKSSL
jgi:hypothetical protein